ncbi:MAG: lytic transglycosylase domain-containing protein [Brevinematia bacterium]
MIEGVLSAIERIKEIHSRISEIKAIGEYRSLSQIREVSPSKNTTSEETKKFSDVLKEVLQENNTLPGLSMDEATARKINLLAGDKSENGEILKSMYQNIKDNYSQDKIETVISKAAEKFGVDSALIKAIIRQESQFNRYAVSPKGALGLMQLMPQTAELLGVNNPFDITENIFGGTRYIKMLLDKYRGDLNLALAAYNAGPNSVDNYGGIPDYEETKDYVDNVIKYYNIYKNFK